MILLYFYADNFYNFNELTMDFGHYDDQGNLDGFEVLQDYPNFYYKKTAILYGKNASGKTTLAKFLNEIAKMIKEPLYCKQFIKYIRNPSLGAEFKIQYVSDGFLKNLCFFICDTTKDVSVKTSKVKLTKDLTYETATDMLLDVKELEFHYNFENDGWSGFNERELSTVLEDVKDFNPVTDFNQIMHIKEFEKLDPLFSDALYRILKTIDPALSKDEINALCAKCFRDEHISNLPERFITAIRIAKYITLLQNNPGAFYYLDCLCRGLDNDIAKAVLWLMRNLIEDVDGQIIWATNNIDSLELNTIYEEFAQSNYFILVTDNRNIVVCKDYFDFPIDDNDSVKDIITEDCFEMDTNTHLISLLSASSIEPFVTASEEEQIAKMDLFNQVLESFNSK